ncbi:hypothetical protein RC62_1005 [Flavobacterium aquidurense]|uniref:Uncharacterized protein n=1 Tax=Flavobacterium aquidurense TaxID=362413 RepID=A0A0N8VMH3_9FLAO|nr:hypothetical protein RC62_1005 [Flavobacterium aquidurense]
MASAKKELVNYYQKGKISLKNFAEVLGYKESDLDIIESTIKYYS